MDPYLGSVRIIKNERCFNCRKKGHIARKCPKYRPANRSAEVNHTTESEPVSDNKELKSGSGYKTGKNNPRTKSHSEKKGRFSRKNCSNHKQNE
jgi:hypothetical protein